MRAFRLRYPLFAALLSCLLAAGAAPPATTSTPTSAPPSLRAAVDSAWQRSPLVRTQSTRLDESEALRRQAQSWLAGAPTVGLSQRSDRWTDQRGERETEVSLGASVWLPGQKSARQAAAERAAADADAQLALARLSVAGEVRNRMWEAAAAREALAEKRDHLHHLEELAADVDRRVAAGELARSDGLLARQELLAVQSDVAAARMAAGEALARFQVLTGYADLPPLEPEALADGGDASDIRVRAARAALHRAEANLALATSTRQPPPTVSLSMRRETDPGTLAPSRSIGVAVQIPLGSRTRNGPAETLAATQVAGASAEAAQAEALAAADIALAREQHAIARQALDAATARAAAMREHTRLFDTAFKEGERSLAELLRSRALSHEAEVAARRQRVLLGQAHSRLNQALGILP